MSAIRMEYWSSSTVPIELLDNRVEIRRPTPPERVFLR